MASDPEELLDALDDAEIIGIVTDAMGDWVKVGVLRTAVLIGVNGSPAILDTPERRDEFARYWMQACRQAEAAEAEPPRDDADCRCGPDSERCPCDANGDDGLCSCCREGDCNGSCALAPHAVTPDEAAQAARTEG